MPLQDDIQRMDKTQKATIRQALEQELKRRGINVGGGAGTTPTLGRRLLTGGLTALRDIGASAAGVKITTPEAKTGDLGTFAQKELLRQQIKQPFQQQIVQEKQTQKQQQEIIKEQNKLEDVVGEIETIQADVNDLLNTFLTIDPRNRGPIQGRTLGQFARFGQSDPALVDYEDTKQFFLSNISRKLGGERGVLTDRDIERVEGLFPQLRDTDEVAAKKIRRINDFIQRRIDDHKERVSTKVNRLQRGEGIEIEEPLQIFNIEEIEE